MRRKMIAIDEDRCNGCGLCIPNCPEGAIQILDGKARVKASLCDGLGACLGHCPQGALTIEERETEAYNDRPVMQNTHCPGSGSMSFSSSTESPPALETGPVDSRLTHWPIQLHLISPVAPQYRKRDVLLAADCTAYAVGDFHQNYLAGKSLVIACPKLDPGQEIYLEKLTALIRTAEINSLIVMTMEVPCCSGLLRLAQTAVTQAGRKIPLKHIQVSLRGKILNEEWL